MKFVIQRVTEASVTVNHQVIGAIEKGFLVLIGVSNQDTKEIADKMIKKLSELLTVFDYKLVSFDGKTEYTESNPAPWTANTAVTNVVVKEEIAPVK